MNQLQASTGSSAEETEKYQAVLEAVYKNNYGEDFNDIAEAISQVTKNMGEMDDANLQNVTESAFALQDIFEYEISESTRAAKAMMDNFGIDGQEAMNKIAAGAQNGLDYSGELLDSISEYSVQFSKMGFTADDMFNIFQKGTDTGAFNLDKIGDAVKENAIRVIDCSDSTAEAFQKLGLASEDLSEPMSKAQEEAVKYSDKIEDLSDKLELAKIKQSEFTDKTSEATKLSNEKTIKKYTEELAEAEAGLNEVNSSIESMNAQMQNSGPSVEEFAQKFAAGGETAQEAFDQVMTGIIALNDPLEQNAVGTALFGTMWEDLGPEVVGALGEIGDAAYGTGEELESMKDVKYDDLGSSLDELMRGLELLLVPLGEALLPLITELISLLTPFVTECIAPILEALSPLITMISEMLIPILSTLLSVVSSVFGGIASDVASVIGNVIEILKSLVSFIVNVLTGNWTAAWENIKNIFENIMGGIGTVLKWPINFIIDILNGLIKGINSIQIPDWVPVIGGASANIPTIPRLKVGMDYVPSDDFPALLHEGEAVLTKQENAAYRQLGGVVGMTDMLNTPDYKSYADPFGTFNFDYEKLANIVGKSNGDIVLTMNGNELMRWIREENESYRIRTDGVGYLD
nr:phage tail tape measure protein [Ruminococcus sp. OA3]